MLHVRLNFLVPFLVVLVVASVTNLAMGHPGHGSDPKVDEGHSHAHDHVHGRAELTGEAGGQGQISPVVLGMYGIGIALASLGGGAIPGRWRFSHLQFQLLISLIGGLMLGVAVLHLLVHAVHEAGAGAINQLAWALLGGMLVMFLLLRAFHVHYHPDEPERLGSQEKSNEHVHGPACTHDHDHDSHSLPVAGRWGWLGLFVGLGLHTILDGIALAIAMKAESVHGALLPGLGTFLAVALHKPVDALSIVMLMRAGGWSGRARGITNFVFALLAPAAAAAVALGLSSVEVLSGQWLGMGLSASAGMFLCIALSDLLPEMQFHSHHRWRLTAALLTGVAVAWGIQFLEPDHLH